MKGFTLIEVMITVVIFSVLAVIVYPSYLEKVYKSRRTDATSALLQVAQILERCYTEFNAYNHPRCSLVTTIDGEQQLKPVVTGREGVSGNGYYVLTVMLTSGRYRLTATPRGKGGQNHDSCGTYTLTHTGARTPVIPGCW